MNAGTWALFAATLVVAAIDWWAVGRGNVGLEYVAKPATMVMLFLATVAIEPHDTTVQTAFLIAIVFSLGGDVFLMLPQDLFVFGLASFLCGHVAYVVGMVIDGIDPTWAAVAGVVVGLLLVTLGREILGAVKASDTPELFGPVVVYIGVISIMVVSAAGTGRPIALVGALLFYSSDALIAWTRFIADVQYGRLIVMITYHLGQIGICLSLAS
ncbi:MAG TPA: lysoplasmalogenase [Acidimicrobiales bacterium]|nr:lysoplasmalogenase [Acidimicrobiales bacterium]